MNHDFEKITNNIKTKQDLVYLLDDINQAKELIYKGESKDLSKKTKNKISEELRGILKEQQGNLNSREEQEDFLEQLKTHLKEIPQLKLTLAFSPSDNFLEEISQWLENETGQQIIIDLTVNPKIVGGAIIEYDGHYSNLALKKKIENLSKYE